MPRKPIDWSKCMFYRLVCRDPTITDYYVGSTCNEIDRRYKHKHACTNPRSKAHNYFVYEFIRSHGGWQNWMLIVHEKRPMNNEYEAAIRERYWVEQYKATLNIQVPSRSREEYRADHHEQQKVYNFNYRIDNINKIKNRDAQYYVEHREHLTKKHNCSCGGRYTTVCRSRHFKSKKHTAFEAAK